VAVSDHIELSGDPYLVPEGGVVLFPEIGGVKVSGLTIGEINDLLTKKFNTVLYNARVTTVLRLRRVLEVSVLGDVFKPAVVPIQVGLTVADAISAAGGLKTDLLASDVNVTVTHRDGSRATFPLTGLLNGEKGDNPVLQEGDSVFLDAGIYSVYVVGQVFKPGIQLLKRGSGILEAISQSGGPTPQGAISRVQLVHLNGQEQIVDLVPAMVQGKRGALPKLVPGDLITVPMTTSQFAVLGHVKSPGVFPLPDGQTVTLAQAIALAGGDVRGRVGKISVARNDGGKQSQHVYDFTKYLAKADPTENPRILPGDVVFVPETNHIDNALLLGALGVFGVLYSTFNRG
jgi:polysaccharide export outer membrane protein